MADNDDSTYYRVDEVPPVDMSKIDYKPKPWQKPRKQWVREKQWRSSVGSLLSDLNLNDRPLSYLTFPGEDFLDIRDLHELAQDADFSIRFLGFNSAKSTKTNLSYSEVLDLPRIAADSNLIPDKFETVADNQSLGYERVGISPGYDVVNLDFCNSVASDEAGTEQSSFDAILHLIELQTSSRTEPWLLFITCRSDHESVRESIRKKFAKVFIDNCNNVANFEGIAAEAFALDAAAVQLVLESNEAAPEELLNRTQDFHFFGVGLTKWLISLSHNEWRIQPTTVAGYRVFYAHDVCDMHSIVYRFDRVPRSLNDRTGITPARNATVLLSEGEIALAALPSLKGYCDLDVYLHENKLEQKRFNESNAALMQQARYDYDQTLAWGAGIGWTPDKVQQKG